MKARVLAVVVLAVLLLAFAAGPAVAATVAQAADVQAQEDGPAVPAPPDAEPEEEEPWTSRFLIPAGILLSVVVIGGVILVWARKRSQVRVVQ